MSRRPAAVLAALLVAAAGGSPQRARGRETTAVAPVAVEAKGGRIQARLGLGPALPPDLAKHLSSGLTNVIAIHVALLPERGDEPIALYGREVDVLYDVWEESFAVTVKDPQSPRGRSVAFRDLGALQAFLKDASGIDLGPAGALGEGRFVVETRVDVNPVSKELLERTREFIANPAAAARGGGPSRSVLGAMASYLLRGADSDLDTRVLRSPPFTAREVAGL